MILRAAATLTALPCLRQSSLERAMSIRLFRRTIARFQEEPKPRCALINTTPALLGLLLVMTTAGLAHAATTWYVSPNGNDSDGLSPQTAFRTPQQAADVVDPGDTVLIMDGVYASGPNQNSLNIERSGTADAPITFKAAPGAKPVLKVQAWEGVGVRGSSYIVIEGLTVEGVAKEITYEEAYSSQLGDTIPARMTNNCFAVIPDYATRRLSHHVKIIGNTARQCSGAGIYSVWADYVTIENNHVYDNAWWSSYANSGISTYQNRDIDDSTDTKMVIRNNVLWGNANFIPFRFSDPDPAKRSITDGNGIIIDDARNTQTIIDDTPAPPYRGRTLVENNIAVGNGARGIHIYLSDRVDVINNTAADNGWSPAIREGDFSVSNSEDVFVGNNIAAPLAGKQALTIENGNDRVWLGDNLFAGDPMFFNRARGDFRLRRGSPGIDTADPRSSSTTDRDGRARPIGRGPDMGAYER
jgi:parallel beta-helix repeat protein